MRAVVMSSDVPEFVPAKGASDLRSEPLQLKWLDSFETGHPEIDRVHRKLILDCNALLAMISTGSNWAEIVARARRLIDDCVAHFRLEESILAGSAFSRLAEHEAEHLRLEQEMRAALFRMAKRDEAFEDRFEHARWLGAILIDAIVRNDLDFRSHILNEQGR